MLDKTSIIVVACDFQSTQRRVTKACLGCISKWTDREDYELILVDQKPCMEIESRYHKIDIDKHLIVDDIGGAQAFNLGAKESNPEYKYICFLHNDVMVIDNWLPMMLEPLSRGFTQTMPIQGMLTREEVKLLQQQEDPGGYDDAGMICMTKEEFAKTGGWDERFPNLHQDLAFRKRFKGSTKVVGKCLITHISAITMFADDKRRERCSTEEGEAEKKIRGTNNDGL